MGNNSLSVAVPHIANFHLIEYNIHAHSETFGFQHSFSINKRPANFRFMQVPHKTNYGQERDAISIVL